MFVHISVLFHSYFWQKQQSKLLQYFDGFGVTRQAAYSFDHRNLARAFLSSSGEKP